MEFKWCAHSCGRNIYAKTYNNEKSCGLLMHVLIAWKTDGMMIDHRNRNGLDNQRSNLRHCTRSQNLLNSKARSGTETGFKGVSFHVASGRYTARIGHNGKRIHIGYFQDPISAAIAYNQKAKSLYPDHAWLNDV